MGQKLGGAGQKVRGVKQKVGVQDRRRRVHEQGPDSGVDGKV